MSQPVYVVNARRGTSGAGIVGFVFFFLGFLTFGLLWPIGLVINFLALCYDHGGVNVAGLVLNLLATLIGCSGLVLLMLAAADQAMTLDGGPDGPTNDSGPSLARRTGDTAAKPVRGDGAHQGSTCRSR